MPDYKIILSDADNSNRRIIDLICASDAEAVDTVAANHKSDDSVELWRENHIVYRITRRSRRAA